MQTKNNLILKVVYVLLALQATTFSSISAQIAGNAVYGTNNNPYYNTNTKPNTSNIQSGKTFLISSDILYHAIADRYVAVFGIVQEGKSIKECAEIVENRIANFTSAMQKLGIPKDAILLDAITQNRIYEYQLNEDKNIAEEKLVGFEIKKNIIVSYTSSKMLDKIMIAASEYEIYDLIKVDYIIDDPDKIYNSLYEEALKVIEQKKQFYLQLTEKKHFGYPEIIRLEKDMIPPVQAYKSYTAHETNSITANNHYNNNKNFKTVNARRVSTYYYEAAPKTNFDKVMNEHQLEPSVQFVFRLQLRFEVF